MVNTKRVQGLAIVCLGIFVSLLFLLTHWYLKEAAVIDFKMWDVETVTASDFTVEYAITEEVWTHFKNRKDAIAEKYPENQGLGLLMQFENYLESELIAKMNTFPHVINNIEVGFANVTFAYDNQQLLRLLSVRGSFITSGKFDKVPAINK